MAKVTTKHFQYSGTDDYDMALDTQMNEYIQQENIEPQDIISVLYDGHSALGVNTYSALLVYNKKD